MSGEIWDFGKDTFKIFLEDESMKDEISRWDGCRLHCFYYLDGKISGWDIIFPSKLHRRILKFVHNPQNGKKAEQ